MSWVKVHTDLQGYLYDSGEVKDLPLRCSSDFTLNLSRYLIELLET